MAEQNLPGAYENPYRFNAKELDRETNLYYYGARYYNPKLSIWYGVDPLAEKYPSWSPYVYVMNNPVNAVDPDGKVVIFINGMHIGDGGRSEYWNGLDNRLMNRLSDRHAIYRDGAIGGARTTFWTGLFSVVGGFNKNNLLVYVRKQEGKTQGYSDAKGIFENLADGETIKVATHSMGGAYGKGYVKGLKKYANENNIDIAGRIEEIDLAPFQPTQQIAEPGVPTTVIAHKGDSVAGSEPMKGANNNVTRQNKTRSRDEHSVDSFSKQEINDFIPQHTPSPRAGSSKQEQNPIRSK